MLKILIKAKADYRVKKRFLTLKIQSGTSRDGLFDKDVFSNDKANMIEACESVYNGLLLVIKGIAKSKLDKTFDITLKCTSKRMLELLRKNRRQYVDMFAEGCNMNPYSFSFMVLYQK